MTTIGLRELRQQASDLVRRVEAGEEMTITVSGRPSARLIPIAPRSWRRWDDIAELFEGPADQALERDRERLDDTLQDPWQPRQTRWDVG
jgi:prevent-host-death family protein